MRPTAPSTPPDGSTLRQYTLLLVIFFCAMSLGLVFGVVIPILPNLATHFGGGSSGAFLAQLLFSTACVGMMLGGPLVGWLVAHRDARLILAGALAMFTLAGAAGLFLESAGAFLVARFLLGVAAGGINASGVALISQRYGGERRGQVLGYYNACGPIAAVVALALAGTASESAGWRAPFVFYFIGAVVLALALASVPRTLPLPAAASASKAGVAQLRRQLMLQLLALVTLSIPLFTVSVQVPFLLAEQGHARPSLVAAIAAAGSVSIAAGALLYGAIRKCLGTPGTLIGLLALMAGGHLLIGLSPSIALITAGACISQFGGGLLLPHFLEKALGRAPASAHGKVSGMVYSAQFLGIFLNSLVMAPPNAWLGVQNSLLLLGCSLGIATLAAAAYVLISRSAPEELPAKSDH